MKKTWGIRILIALFVWMLGRDLMSLLLSSADSVDYAVYSVIGMTYLFFVFGIASAILETAVLYFLFRPAKVGFFVALATLLLSMITSTVVTILVLANPERAKAAYITSRQVRGLSVRPELYDALFTPAGMLGILAIAFLLTFVVAFLLFWNRRYFWGPTGQEIGRQP